MGAPSSFDGRASSCEQYPLPSSKVTGKFRCEAIPPANRAAGHGRAERVVQRPDFRGVHDILPFI